MPLSSPISWRATRPSCVSTSSPVESMSSRPAGARPRSCCGAKRSLDASPLQWLRGVHQHHRRLVAVFGLAADVADRLVQQDRHLALLLAVRFGVDVDARVGPDLQAHHGELAVHAHPALGDPVVGLAARAQAQRGHSLVQAGGGNRQ